MEIRFPYPGYERIAAADVPDANLLGVWEPAAVPGVDEEAVLRRGFQAPVGAPRLRDSVEPGDRVLLLIDDGTRFTPVWRILPHVLDELAAGGVGDTQVTFLTAQGTHREMTAEELGRKLGPFYERFRSRIHQHHWLNEQELHDFGRTRDGTPVTANKLLAQSDFVLGIGSIVPHRVKGFGGGAKIAFPGVSGPEMMYRNQWEASMQMSETVMGVAENSMRLRMEEAAAMAGLRYIVNVVLDRDRRIVGCFCGDPMAAFRQGCRLSREVNAARMPARAQIVLIDSHPADANFWQSAKGLYAATMAVRDGGTIILVAPNPEGAANNHPNLMEIGYRPHAELVALAQSGEVEDLVGLAVLADVAQIIDKSGCVIVSPGMKRQEAERIGLHYAQTCETALRIAFERQGIDATVAVLRHGGHILPLADARAAASMLA